jgi:hypothetical protein
LGVVTEWYTVHHGGHISEATIRIFARDVGFNLAPDLGNVLGKAYTVPDGKMMMVARVVDNGQIEGYLLVEEKKAEANRMA